MEQEQKKEGCCGKCGLEWQPEHFGNPRKCAFEGEKFSGDNWNCGLVAVIRDAMYDNEEERSALRYRNDMGIGSVGALVVEVPSTDPEDYRDYSLAGLLVATWYKDRGCTDSLGWAFEQYDDSMNDLELTTEQAIKIAAHLKSVAQRQQEQEEARYTHAIAEQQALAAAYALVTGKGK